MARNVWGVKGKGEATLTKIIYFREIDHEPVV